MAGPSDHSDGPPLVLKSENFFNCLLITELSRRVATETSNDKHPHSQSVCVCVCVTVTPEANRIAVFRNGTCTGLNG